MGMKINIVKIISTWLIDQQRACADMATELHGWGRHRAKELNIIHELLWNPFPQLPFHWSGSGPG